MSVKLYGLAVSHPSFACRAMLDHKGIDYELVNFPPLSQPIALRAAGFRGRKVPALRIDGRKVQGSLARARGVRRPPGGEGSGRGGARAEGPGPRPPSRAHWRG